MLLTWLPQLLRRPTAGVIVPNVTFALVAPDAPMLREAIFCSPAARKPALRTIL